MIFYYFLIMYLIFQIEVIMLIFLIIEFNQYVNLYYQGIKNVYLIQYLIVIMHILMNL